MKLTDLTLSNVHSAEHRATMRLILRVTAETHRLFRRTYDAANAAILASVDDEGMVDATKLQGRVPAILNQFQRDVKDWNNLFERAREQAANIAFGGLVVAHNAYFGGLAESAPPPVDITEQVTPEQLAAAVTQAERQGITARQVDTMTRLWEQRRARALTAAAQRVQSDGLVLSSRIWSLENGGIQSIRNTLLTAFSERTSAARLANLLESALGAGQNCPRWAYSRLYRMDARERAADDAGLLRDDECRSTGISYNALRLARTEIQYAHNQMQMDIYENAPWVNGYKVRLSPTHPAVDICDELAAGGPYAPNNLVIPAHPNCLCYTEPVIMDRDAFRMNVRAWLAGENQFLDGYARWLGTPAPLAPLPWTMSLASALELWLNTSASGQAAAIGV